MGTPVIYETLESALRYKDCKNEQQFKTSWIKENAKHYKALFPIETEETVQGFPDVLAIDFDNTVTLFEFKVCNRNGVFKFQPTQPAFYRKHSKLPVYINVLHSGDGASKPVWVSFFAQRLFDNKLIDEKGCVSIKSVLNVFKQESEEETL